MTQNKYTTDSRGEHTPMPRPLLSARENASPQAAQVRPDMSLARESYRPEPATPADPGFYVVPRSMSPAELFNGLFEAIPPSGMVKYSALNPGMAGTIKAGTLIVLSDPKNHSCTYAEAQLMQAAAQVKVVLDPLTSEEADFIYRHQNEIASFLGTASTWSGVSVAVMEQHLAKLRDTLQAMERLHQDSYRKHGHLRAPEFFAERTRLLAQVDAYLLSSMRLRGQTSIGDHPKLKTALGISSRSLVHHWSKAGAPGQIPGYATHVSSMSRAARYMQAGGYIGIGVGGGASLLAIQDVCNAGSAEACKKVKYTESSKFTGATVGGVYGANWGLGASGSVCLALGVSTGIGGVMCVAAVVGVGGLVGTGLGGAGGELLGNALYEVIAP